MECVAEKPENRPAMPKVLERLRKMEVEILSRLTIGQGEHVGSIKIVKGKGKVTQANATKAFSNLFAQREPSVQEETDEYHNAKEQQDEFEYDTEEEVVAKMMEGSLKVERGDEEITTWRTARWDEPKADKQTVMDIFKNPPGMRIWSRLLRRRCRLTRLWRTGKIPGSYPSVLHQDYPATSSSIMTVKATKEPVVEPKHVDEVTQEPFQTQSEIPSILDEEHWQVAHKQEKSDTHMSIDEPEEQHAPQTQIMPATHRLVDGGKQDTAELVADVS